MPTWSGLPGCASMASMHSCEYEKSHGDCLCFFGFTALCVSLGGLVLAGSLRLRGAAFPAPTPRFGLAVIEPAGFDLLYFLFGWPRVFGNTFKGLGGCGCGCIRWSGCGCIRWSGSPCRWMWQCEGCLVVSYSSPAPRVLSAAVA